MRGPSPGLAGRSRHKLEQLSSLLGCEVPPAAFFQLAQLDVGHANPFQVLYGMAHLAHHAADLAVAAFLEDDEKTVGGKFFHLRRPGLLALYRHPPGQLL